LVRSLAKAPRPFGLAARVDPGEVAEQMVTGLDWQRLPAWAETTATGLDLLAGQEMHRRTLWLAIPLSAPCGWSSTPCTAASRSRCAPAPVPAAAVRPVPVSGLARLLQDAAARELAGRF
jgi:hypothetical protein